MNYIAYELKAGGKSEELVPSKWAGIENAIMVRDAA